MYRMDKDSQASRASLTAPLPSITTPITPNSVGGGFSVEGDKYNHLALYQQFEARNNNLTSATLNSYHNQFTYPNSYHHIVPQTLAIQQPSINSLNLFAPYGPASQVMRVPSPVFAPFVTNPAIPNSLNIFGDQTARISPNILDTGTTMTTTPLQLHPPRPASTIPLSLTERQLSNSRGGHNSSSLNDNLIDLDTSLDSFNSMSVADLFDPLYEKKQPLPPPPPPAPQVVTNPSSANPITPPSKQDEPKTSPVVYRKNSTINQTPPGNRNAAAKPKELPKKKDRSSSSSQINVSDSTDILRIVRETSSPEFAKFNQTISELRHRLAKQPEDLTSLITFNPVIECPILRKINVKLIIRYNSSSSSLNSSSNLSSFDQQQQSSTSQTKRYQMINLQVSVNASVETIVYDVLTTLNIEDLDTKKYLLKIHGLEEFLPVNSTLAELKYMSDCLVENKDPVLVLTELKHANTDLTSRQNSNSTASADDTTFIYSLNVGERMFRGETVSDLYNKMDAIMRGLCNNRRSLIDSLSEQAKGGAHHSSSSNQTDLVLSWLVNLRAKIKGLVALFNDAMDDSVIMIIERLEMFEKQIKADLYRKSLKERQPLITSDDNYDYRIDKMNSSGGSGGKGDCLTTLNEFVTKNLLIKLASYMNSVFRSFYLPFRVIRCKSNSKENERVASVCDNSERVETIQANEKFFVYFNGLSRLSYFLNGLAATLQSTTELFLKFSLVYGTRPLDYVVVKLDKLLQRKLDTFTSKKCKILFDRLDLCQLPRETHLLVQIYTTTINTSNASLFASFQESHTKIYVNNEQIELVSSSANKISSNMIDKCLAWTSKSIFNDQLAIPSDEFILAFFEGEVTQAISTTASNVFNSKSPLIQITFPDYDYNYVYPSTPTDCDCQLKDFHQLSADNRERLLAICNKNIFANPLTESDREFINHHYLYLSGIPNALAKVFLSFPTWDFSSIIHFYAFLKQSDPLALSESLELLLSTFPDTELRSFAIRSLEQHTPETLSLYLPQLLEAIKYEYQHDSQLTCLLLTLASKSISFAHRLYWQLEELKSRSNECMHLRYLMTSDALKYFFNKQMLDEIELEQFLVERIDEIAARLKETKESEQLYNELDCLCKEWQSRSNCASCRMPYNISYSTREIDIKSCSIISSFTMPIKLVFKNVDPTANSFYSIYKIGDDLRQDMFVLQMINVMNQLWLMDDLDLNVLTFTVMQTGSRRGFIEMITNAETLKEIQKGAVKNAFKKSCISDWLSSHNPNQVNYKLAVENFTRSCAAYSVATYILGIGDRHNDNLMVKYTGHMFHIDFGKYLGDAQTFAGFKRDRTPFLFTFDMFYVINQAKEPSFRFQEFIDLCCRAFQVLRTNYHLLISLIQLMMNSGIPGLNHHAISYVYKNLMIEMSEDESSNVFKKLIHDSLSKFASINFAIHTMAQPKTVNSSNFFSFVTYIYNSETDGKIVNVKLEKPVKSDVTSTDYYKCLVTRETEYDNNVVYRTFDEFNELLALLNKTFPTLRAREPPGLTKFKDFRGHERFQIVNVLVNFIMGLQPEIRDSDIVYTFFHSVSRDRKLDSVYNDDQTASTSFHSRTLSLSKREMESDFSRFDIKGQIKVKIKYKDGKFSVNCLQCRNLKSPGTNQPVSSLRPYVKCYLKPDAGKVTKKKVQALFNGANPIFHETMEYDMAIGELRKRVLELSVLNNKLNNKERIGSVEISLSDLNWDVEHVKWFDLK